MLIGCLPGPVGDVDDEVDGDNGTGDAEEFQVGHNSGSEFIPEGTAIYSSLLWNRFRNRGEREEGRDTEIQR